MFTDKEIRRLWIALYVVMAVGAIVTVATEFLKRGG